MANSFHLAIVSLSVNSLKIDEFSAYLDHLVKQAKQQQASLVLFPEFSIAPIIEAMKGDLIAATQWLEDKIKVLAVLHKLYICGGSGAYLINEKLYNQAFLINPTGQVIYQPKINLIESEKTDHFTGGNYIHIFNTPFVKFAICICYDIEFPELTRELALQGVDLILNPSYTVDQFGENRVRYCAQARTVENHIYVAKSCLVGRNGHSSTPEGFGKSALYSPIDHGFMADGIIAETKHSQTEELLIVEVDLKKLDALRQQSSTSPINDHKKLKSREITIETIQF